uniref:Uncharacterized protein n=1 Tax=Tetranychus urticae TaxID=32264 RepID=T1KIJ3_TETUR
MRHATLDMANIQYKRTGVRFSEDLVVPDIFGFKMGRLLLKSSLKPLKLSHKA